MKFLVNKVGIEEFRELVRQEREILPHDERWVSDIEATRTLVSKPLLPESILNLDIAPEAFKTWFQSNVRPQRQRGYATITVACPLGDLSAFQMRGIADIAREFVGDNIRLTVEQNLSSDGSQKIRSLPSGKRSMNWRLAIQLLEPSLMSLLARARIPANWVMHHHVDWPQRFAINLLSPMLI